MYYIACSKGFMENVRRTNGRWQADTTANIRKAEGFNSFAQAEWAAKSILHRNEFFAILTPNVTK
jgi:hypothetical protein